MCESVVITDILAIADSDVIVLLWWQGYRCSGDRRCHWQDRLSLARGVATQMLNLRFQGGLLSSGELELSLGELEVRRALLGLEQVLEMVWLHVGGAGCFEV